MHKTIEPSGVTLSTYLEPAAAAALRARAAKEDRTVAAEIRRAVRAYLNDEGRAFTPALVKTPARTGRHDAD